MTDRPKLSAPRLRVVMADGAEFEVQATNRDLVGFEREAARRKWPSPQDAPFTWLTYLAWSASRRDGLLDSAMTLPAFEGDCLDVSNLSDDDDDSEVTPTPPAPVAG